VNRKLTDAQIAAAATLLRGTGRRVTGRALREMLRRQYGAAGKTARLLSACRSVDESQTEQSALTEAQARLLASEQSRALALQERDHALARAERAEARELAHQDRWASEIHTLRESVEQLKGERVRRQSLEEQVVRLQRELQSLHRRLVQDDEPPRS
jgi:hypothetical protein